MSGDALQGLIYMYRMDILLLTLDGLFTRAPLEWLLMNKSTRSPIFIGNFSFLMLTIISYQILVVASKFIYVCSCQRLSAPIISMTSVFTWFRTRQTLDATKDSVPVHNQWSYHNLFKDFSPSISHSLTNHSFSYDCSLWFIT